MERGGFNLLLEESVKIHGHLCPGQVLGVRMSLLGLRGAGISDPKGTDRKNLMVFVEMDRCATDAIQSVTGCTLGHRTMKFLDYGKMAATFVNLKTGMSIRVIAKEGTRDRARERFPGIDNKYLAQLEAYKMMADEDLFDVMEVDVPLNPEDMPGRPLRRVKCDLCGEWVQDMRETRQGGRVVCRACADGGYYTARSHFLSASVMQKSHNGIEIRSKLWIEVDGEPVFGRGREFLLRAIDAHGSISQAAKEIGISYRKAWSYIKSMEERLDMKLVERKAGGRNGGGASLTKEARDLLGRYRMMDEGIRDVVDAKFRRLFR
ncbi:MAG TPA: FmdE family protein [Thermodesulfovibrionales bacterium]|nr:FmdE family protein [Thermodesulfovibrionales bacterium]